MIEAASLPQTNRPGIGSPVAFNAWLSGRKFSVGLWLILPVLGAVDDGDHHNFGPLLVYTVDNNVRPFEEFSRARHQPWSAHMSKLGDRNRITLASMRAIIAAAARGLSLAIHANM